MHTLLNNSLLSAISSHTFSPLYTVTYTDTNTIFPVRIFRDRDLSFGHFAFWPWKKIFSIRWVKKLKLMAVIFFFFVISNMMDQAIKSHRMYQCDVTLFSLFSYKVLYAGHILFSQCVVQRVYSKCNENLKKSQRKYVCNQWTISSSHSWFEFLTV